MPATDFNTWNPVLHLTVQSGGIGPSILRERTLEFVYVDRARQFDYIEWELDNRDGLLTRPEYISAGLMCMFKLGYLDNTFPWKAFIVNRLRGGVGVWSGERRGSYVGSNVGANESRITFYGRNRNAPGGKAPRQWRRRTAASPRSRRRQKIYPPTRDVTKHEMVLNQDAAPKVIYAKSTSEAVRLIADRNGFSGSYARIQPTNDHIDAVVIPEGLSDGVYLRALAHQFGYDFKIDGDIFRWHSASWKGVKNEIVDVFVYGAGPDILELNIDADFRLPLPGKTKGQGYSLRQRVGLVGNLDYDEAAKASNIGRSLDRLMEDPVRSRALTRTEIFPVLGDSLKQADEASLRRFFKRHFNALQLIVKITGNPRVLATKLVRLKGTGSPFVDRVWYVTEARHTLTDSTYVTEMRLKQPPRHMDASAGNVKVGLVGNLPYDKQLKASRIGRSVDKVPVAWLERL